MKLISKKIKATVCKKLNSNIICFQVEYDRPLQMVFGIACLLLSFLASIGNLASLIYVKLNWNVNNKVIQQTCTNKTICNPYITPRSQRPIGYMEFPKWPNENPSTPPPRNVRITPTKWPLYITLPQKRPNYTHQMTMVLVTNIALTDLLNGMFSASFNAANFFRQLYPDPEPMVK